VQREDQQMSYADMCHPRRRTKTKTGLAFVDSHICRQVSALDVVSLREPLVTQRCNALIGLFQYNLSVSVYALRRRAIAILFFNVLLPVLVGGGIYSLWRSKALLVFDWYRWAGLYAPLLAFRSEVVGARHFIPDPVL
jgi:hypothetical protein